ncbi:hypothetical protein SUGI_0786880 [Cryptomeria japonica]|uniref:acyltransferase GLAUCE n=1 Tax=Cryptomeria japonica TaxID=3369 RepID=UPI00241477AB|nr:acyltransferase GLAUCE [Cryptomeria japonica]GLJ38594.1 hypothetical protein SUGI_0786880 [Cryptomeria japonica]
MKPSSVSLVSDLRVKKDKFSVLHPEKTHERRTLFLSNFDQKFVHYVIKYVHFFSAPSQIPFDLIVAVYAEVLSRLMAAYDFLCGRLTFNSEQGRFEIDCNDAGAPFVICSSELSLQELGDITIPNPAFSQLCFTSESSNRTLENEPLLSYQMTRFKCGGYSLGTTVNHGVMDGFALEGYARNFTCMAVKGEPAFEPVIDRSCLKARSPLQIKYEHEEYLDPSKTSPHLILSSITTQRNKEMWHAKMAHRNVPEAYVLKSFFVSGKMVETLKMKAADDGVKQCSSFMVALAHVWQTRTISIGNMNAQDVSTVHYAVETRSRFVPPLPWEFAGNGTVTACAKATGKQLQEEAFGEIVKKLQEGSDRMTDEYLRSSIDWLELHDGVQGLENGFLATNWKHLGFGEIELKGGFKSLYGGPVVSGGGKIVVFLPHPEDKKGMQFYLGLEACHMDIFEKLIETV